MLQHSTPHTIQHITRWTVNLVAIEHKFGISQSVCISTVSRSVVLLSFWPPLCLTQPILHTQFLVSD